MDVDTIVQPVIELVRANEGWTAPIVFGLAFGGRWLPATVALIGIGALIGATSIDFVSSGLPGLSCCRDAESCRHRG